MTRSSSCGGSWCWRIMRDMYSSFVWKTPSFSLSSSIIVETLPMIVAKRKMPIIITTSVKTDSCAETGTSPSARPVISPSAQWTLSRY